MVQIFKCDIDVVQLSGFGTDVWVKGVRDVQMFGPDTKV